MKTRLALAAASLLIAGPAFAQVGSAYQSAPPPPPTVNTYTPGSNVNSGPLATGSISTEGTGAGTISNNSAGASNAAQPERAIPNVGSTK